MPRTRPGRSPPINGTDPIHASKRPFPRHGCAITNSGRASRESTTFTVIAICSAPACHSRKLLIPKTRGTLRVVGTQGWALCAQRRCSPLFSVRQVSTFLAQIDHASLQCQELWGGGLRRPFLSLAANMAALNSLTLTWRCPSSCPTGRGMRSTLQHLFQRVTSPLGAQAGNLCSA
jgi:hypothetical protein